MFEIKIEKLTHLTYLSLSICEWLFVKILIYCIFMVITFKNTHLWYDNYQTFHVAHKYSCEITMFSRYYKFHKDLKSFNFNHFLSIFAFFNKCEFFLAQIYFNIRLYEIKKFHLFNIWLLWVLNYHNMQKHYENIS
jgi:hypothetical protein